MKSPAIVALHKAGIQPGPFIKHGGELSISGAALVDLSRAVFDKGIPFRFRAKGFSMSPFVKDGDTVTLAPLSHAQPFLGDIVAFVSPGTGMLVVHRVVGKGDKHFLIKGDNMPDVDGFVRRKNILGRVTRVERNGKDVFLGLGPERLLIAFLNRRSLLLPLLSPAWRIVRPIVKRLAL